jgi:small subunit ribosomal protein S3
MGHKVHPYGYRLGYTRTWTAKWYATRSTPSLLKEDIAIRQLLDRRLANASVSGVEIERGINHVTVAIHTAKPGIVIGRGGQNVEILRKEIGEVTKRKVKLEIKEIRQPELDAVPRRAQHRAAADPPRRLQEGDEAVDPAVDEGRARRA